MAHHPDEHEDATHRAAGAGAPESGSQDAGSPELTVERARSVAEQAIVQAQRQGAFDDLAGAGRPLEVIDQPYDPDWWARDKLRREHADLSVALPTVLQLRREKAGLLDAVLALPTEEAVRERLEDFNARVLADRRRPPTTEHSPPVVGRVDVQEYLAQWRLRRPVVEAEEARLAERARREAEAAEAARLAATPRRRWWALWR